MSLANIEFDVLRRTIAVRGTVRLILFPVTVIAWSWLAAGLAARARAPIEAVFPLAVLVAGFEAIHALHVGVERVGRYLQVYYESAADGPRWESTVAGMGPGLPGGGVDPLFSLLFTLVTCANVVPSLLSPPAPAGLAVLAVLHLAFLTRIARARLAAARQRAVELESFRAMRSQDVTR